MKKAYTKSIVATILCSMLAVTAVGCSDNGAQSSAQAETQVQSTTQAETTAPGATNFSLENIHAPKENSADPFVGYWKISEGAGSNLENFIFLFNGKGNASLIIGNMGYCSTYSVGTDEQTGEETFKCQLMFGINGDYSYVVADDGKKITITNNGEDSVLEKIDNPSFVPSTPENPQIDKKTCWRMGQRNGTLLLFWRGRQNVLQLIRHNIHILHI